MSSAGWSIGTWLGTQRDNDGCVVVATACALGVARQDARRVLADRHVPTGRAGVTADVLVPALRGLGFTVERCSGTPLARWRRAGSWHGVVVVDCADKHESHAIGVRYGVLGDDARLHRNCAVAWVAVRKGDGDAE